MLAGSANPVNAVSALKYYKSIIVIDSNITAVKLHINIDSNIKVIRADIRDLKGVVNDNSVDFVISDFTLNFIEDPERAVFFYWS